jgi:hypothetical protein
VFFASFDPVHNGDIALVRYFLEKKADAQVLFVPYVDAIGWSLREREAMLDALCVDLHQIFGPRVKVFVGNTAWRQDKTKREDFVLCLGQRYCLPVKNIVMIGWRNNAVHCDENINDFEDRWKLTPTLVRHWYDMLKAGRGEDLKAALEWSLHPSTFHYITK